MRMICFLLCALAGCGQQYWSNGVRPLPRGEARVLLMARDGAWLPLACYDPDWVRLTGPVDCADLIPPGAEVLVLTGETRKLARRQPTQCQGQPAVAFPDATATGLAIWPPKAKLSSNSVDLDDDGQPERIEWGPEGAAVWQGTRRVGHCEISMM